MSRQRDIAQLYRIAFMNDAIDLDRRKLQEFIVLPGIVATLEQGLVFFSRDKPGAGIFLDQRQSSGVIHMSVGVDEILDVGKLVAQLLNVGFDQGPSLRHRRVDQDMTLR